MLFPLNGYPLIRMPSPWHPNEQLRDIRPVGHRVVAGAGGHDVVVGEGAGLADGTGQMYQCALIATDADAEGYADGYIRHSHEEGNE